MRIYKAP